MTTSVRDAAQALLDRIDQEVERLERISRTNYGDGALVQMTFTLHRETELLREALREGQSA